ncbi:MAG: acyl-CoA thioesterase [Bdellovibrionota bacterium]
MSKSPKVASKKISESTVIMTELVLPSHTNSLQSVFGGIMMSWIDIAAAIAAQRHAQRPVVTASIDALSFVAPVYVGWIVNLKASVNYVSRTSMEIGVRLDAENPTEGQTFHVASAYMTFVALDEKGKPCVVPQIIAETPQEKRRYKAAERRREFRLKLREAQEK